MTKQFLGARHLKSIFIKVVNEPMTFDQYLNIFYLN